jgi:type II secretory pathway component PulM
MSDSHQLTYDQAADAVVELGNRMIEEDDSADMWDVASGMLAGAVQYWLFARQPCANPACEACADVMSAQQRIRTLLAEVEQMAEDADHYDAAHEVQAGTA